MLSLLVAASPVSSQESDSAEDGPQLPPSYQDWLDDVRPLITDLELEVFLELTRDYQRADFVERFWLVRDTFPETGRNEFRDAWMTRLETVRSEYGGTESDRGRVMLWTGSPDEKVRNPCREILRPIEIWSYRASGGFSVVFIRQPTRDGDGYRLWRPIEGLDGLVTWTADAPARRQLQPRQVLAGCSLRSDVVRLVEQAIDWERDHEALVPVPQPSDEWVGTVRARSTELDRDALPLDADLEFSFPGRHQSRTVVQALFTVESADAALGELLDRRSYNFSVTGDVLREGRLFENFQYRYDLPVDGPRRDLILPMPVHRYLRPGEYLFVLKLEDQNSDRAFRTEIDVHVPRISDPVAALEPVSSHGATGPEVADEDPFAEANAQLVSTAPTIRLVPPTPELHVGRLRISAITTGDEITKVGFYLDGAPVVRKTRPPYSVEIDVGEQPRIHVVGATAFDLDGNEVARDELEINTGSHHFDVRLLEPRSERRYRNSVRAEAEVDVPLGERLDRVEFYLDDQLLATLYQPPFALPIQLPRPGAVTYVRALAHLARGDAAEDVVLIHSPAPVDRIEINFVELYTSVSDRRGRPVQGLPRGSFRVFEDGEEQEIKRFEPVADLPIHTGILLDVSTSMAEELREAERAALRFFSEIVTAKDRATVMTFNDFPRVVVPFTADLGVLAGGLAGLETEGETALYDSLIFALYRFAGLKGRRSLIVLTDGEDSASSYEFRDALEYARYTGVAIYPIGINLPSRAVDVRSQLNQLASETGGSSFYIQRATELERVYDRIDLELRSQYLLTYQSPTTELTEEFRTIEVVVDVDQQKLEAKTIRGYYP